jgi:hypothetical protein
MRPLPHLGTSVPDAAVWVCGHQPGGTGAHCGREAVWHGFVLDDEALSIVAVMAACDDHVHRMRLTADYVHPHKHPCGIPGSEFRWPENRCCTGWDEQAEFASALNSNDHA